MLRHISSVLLAPSLQTPRTARSCHGNFTPKRQNDTAPQSTWATGTSGCEFERGNLCTERFGCTSWVGSFAPLRRSDRVQQRCALTCDWAAPALGR